MEAVKRSADEERESYRDGYEKDAAAWRSRLGELEDAGVSDDDPRVGAAKEALENALRHLKAYGGESQSAAQKRPARAREKRG